MILDNTDPFYSPLWRRIVIVAVCFGWAVFELSQGALVWAGLVAAVGLFAVWKLFITFPRDGDDRSS